VIGVASIPLSRPPVDDEIKQAVVAVIDSRQYILGPECARFEAELAAYVGVRHAILTSSATAGLWLALRALGVKAGDEILVPLSVGHTEDEIDTVAAAIGEFFGGR
jgi:dTDP-4-amino-4,6-dideoxygalactose transaminase